RRLPSFVLAAVTFLLAWIIRFTHAEEPGPQEKSDETPAAIEQAAETKREETQSAVELVTAQTKPEEAQDKGPASASAPGQTYDPAVVSAGMAAFERSCTNCHDAARSLERTKDLAGWRATVRRMAAKRGADVAAGDIDPIAVYLTSRNTAAAGTAAEKDKGGDAGGNGAA